MRKKCIVPLFILTLFLLCLSCAPSESLPDKGVTILSPKANDVVQAEAHYEILWKAEPAESEFGTKVTVEFSKDGGKSWEKVEENVSNTGKYTGNIPKIDSNQCKVRIFSQYRPKYRGTSEMFSVK
jgi:hypothetical protein